VILAESFDDTPSPWRERALHVDDFRAALERTEGVDARPMDPLAPAFWCHSSGTSGKPKAVIHGHRFAGEIERVSREGLGIVASDRLFATSKLFFSYPQTNALYAGLKIGATLVLDPQWPNAASVAATVAAQRPTVLLSVPSLYRNLLHDGVAPSIRAAGVRLCVSAGEALPPSLRDGWRKQTGLDIANGYGASETLILVMLDRGDGRGFRPSPGVDIQPLDAVAIGQPTRVKIHASTLALGYLDRPQAQADAFRDGAFVPADLWARDETGAYSFAGREDSLVKIHGRWVNLVDLEERLSAQSPGIREAAAVLVPDADGVDAVAFFFVASDGDAAGAALQAGASGLPPHQRPRWLHAVEMLPRGPTGKLLRRKLAELHKTMES
jgi:acyl-coenzyme A synthetase/AMP-(fatty) acid ligase